MQDINLNIQGIDMSYETARSLAHSIACMMEREPILMAWHDKPHGRMGPEIPGADLNNRWRDYGRSYGGNLEISVNGEYDFIFGDSEDYSGLDDGEQPYISSRDSQGNEYLCVRGGQQQSESGDDCLQLEETTEGPPVSH